MPYRLNLYLDMTLREIPCCLFYAKSLDRRERFRGQSGILIRTVPAICPADCRPWCRPLDALGQSPSLFRQPDNPTPHLDIFG